MSNGTSLSFLVYMIYNKSIWKYKGEESGYMEKAMEKIKNMKNGTASEKQYRVRRCRYTDLAMVLVIAVSIQCFTRLEYAGERYIQSRNGYKTVSYTHLQPIDWDSKDAELNSETIDCIWNGFTMNGREDDYTWSDPYIDNKQVVVVRSCLLYTSRCV